MKKLSIKAISALIAIFLFTTVVRAQEDYVMFLSLNLDPAPGKTSKVIGGLKAHNAKFHAEGDSKAYIWNIVTGPRSGQISWAQGPIKYSKLDEGLTDEHNADWEANVAVHCRSESDVRMQNNYDRLISYQGKISKDSLVLESSRYSRGILKGSMKSKQYFIKQYYKLTIDDLPPFPDW